MSLILTTMTALVNLSLKYQNENIRVYQDISSATRYGYCRQQHSEILFISIPGMNINCENIVDNADDHTLLFHTNNEEHFINEYFIIRKDSEELEVSGFGLWLGVSGQFIMSLSNPSKYVSDLQFVHILFKHRKVISFDMKLFKYNLSHTLNLHNNQLFQCSCLHSFFDIYNSSSIFTISSVTETQHNPHLHQSRSSQRLAMDSILELCGISLPTIYTIPHYPTLDPERSNSNNNNNIIDVSSTCSVLFHTIQVPCHHSANNKYDLNLHEGRLPMTVLCVEDLLPLLTLNTITTTSSRRQPHLLYLSTAAFPITESILETESKDDNTRLSEELVVLLPAISNTNISFIAIKSMAFATADASVAAVASTANDGMSSIEHRHAAHSRAEIRTMIFEICAAITVSQWQSAIHDLQGFLWQLSHPETAVPVTVTAYESTLNLVEAVRAFVVDDSASGYEMRCLSRSPTRGQAEAAASLPAAHDGDRDAKTLDTYFCTDKAARFELASVLSTWLEAAPGSGSSKAATNRSPIGAPPPYNLALASVRSRLQGLVAALETSEGAGRPPSTMRAVLWSGQAFHPDDRVSPTVPSVFVLLFVTADQEQETLRVIQAWKDGVECPICKVYVHYHLIRTTACTTPASTLTMNCGVQSLFRELYLWITRLSVNNDLFIVLRGLAAVKRFRPVGPLGIIPACSEGIACFYRLPKQIVVAASRVHQHRTSDLEIEECKDSPVDLSAFGGLSWAVLDLMQAVRSHPQYYDFVEKNGDCNSSNNNVDCIVKKFVTSDSNIHLDTAFSYFNIEDDNFKFNRPLVDDGATASTVSTEAEVKGNEVVHLILSSVAGLVRSGQINELKTRLLIIQDGFLSELMEGSYVMALRMAFGLQDILLGTELDWAGASFLFKASHNELLRFLYTKSVAHKLDVLALVRGRLEVEEGKGRSLQNRFYSALLYLTTTIWEEIGQSSVAIQTFGRTIVVPSYTSVQGARDDWGRQRRRLARDSAGRHVVHYVTVASRDTAELRNLQLSAELAGLSLTVLGLGQPYGHHGDKVRIFEKHLSSSVGDDDVVVLMDAYDVLLFPAARTYGSVLSKAETPIVFCTEFGLYSDYSAAWFYRTGHTANSLSGNQGTQRFLNSGCVLGRGEQMKAMVVAALDNVDPMQSDQRIYISYHLSHPHLVSLDTDNRFFITGHKLPILQKDAVLSVHRNLSLDLAIPNIRTTNIGLIHCNNRRGSILYETIVELIRYHVRYYRDPVYGDERRRRMLADWDSFFE